MIAVLSLNPSVDRTLHVDRLVPGGLNRAFAATVEAGGKGVNVARVLHRSDAQTVVVLPCGGAGGELLVRRLAVEGVPTHAVPTSGEVRTNVSVIEHAREAASEANHVAGPHSPEASASAVTKLDEPGPELSPQELASLLDAALARIGPGDWLVASGSVPPGVDHGVYARLAPRVAAVGARLAVDTSGPALRAALEARPDLLKPNRDELAELTGMATRTAGEATLAARRVLDSGVPQVLASLGADGALLATSQGIVTATAHCDHVANTVGAGDALLAGYLAAGARGSPALVHALAWARAAVRAQTTAPAHVEPADFDAVHLDDSDASIAAFERASSFSLKGSAQ